MRFGDFIGNRHQVEVIQNAIKTGRLAHAYLFSGKEGIGKRLLATTIAQVLHCSCPQEAPDGTLEPCNSCRPCTKVDHLTHPDLFFLAPDGPQIKIEQIRNLQAKLQYRPLESKRKVVIIEDADCMNLSASNALLRTLEEPPPGTIFFLIATSGNKLLPTIRSRCRHLRFSPLSVEEIKRGLEENLEDMGSYNTDLLAQMAEGSLGQALSLSGQDFQELRTGLIEALLGLEKANVAQIYKFAEEYGRNVEDKLLPVRILKSWWRDLFIFNSLPNEKFVVNKDYMSEIASQGPKYRHEHLWGILQEVDAIEASLAYNASLQIGLEMLFFSVTEVLEGTK